MSRRIPLITWCLFYVWYAWAIALQSYLASPERLGPWTPEFAIVLLIAVEGSLPKREAAGVAIGLALFRTVFSADPPFAALSGLLGLAWTLGAMRELLLIERVIARTTLAFLASLGFLTWLTFAHARADQVAFQPDLFAMLLTALGTASATLVGVPILRKLPGLTPLWQRRFVT